MLACLRSRWCNLSTYMSISNTNCLVNLWKSKVFTESLPMYMLLSHSIMTLHTHTHTDRPHQQTKPNQINPPKFIILFYFYLQKKLALVWLPTLFSWKHHYWDSTLFKTSVINHELAQWVMKALCRYFMCHESSDLTPIQESKHRLLRISLYFFPFIYYNILLTNYFCR